MEQLEFPDFPKAETGVVQPVLMTPPGQKITLHIWEVDSEPDHVCVTLEARDSHGELLALRCGPAPRDEAWQGALGVLMGWVNQTWYETHAPF